MTYNALIAILVFFGGVTAVHVAMVAGWKHKMSLARWPLPQLLVFPAMQIMMVVLMLPLLGNAAGTLMMWAILNPLLTR
jgi:lysylphosphatidylglycerol synthetase-like protein (DUF2156 family)